MGFRQRIYLLSIVASFSLFPLLGIQTERKVYALITLKDYQQASRVGEMLVKDNPRSESAWYAYLNALAKAGDERQLLCAFHQYRFQFPAESTKRDLLESVSWGIIENAIHSSSPSVRICGVLGAFMGQDAKGVEVLKKSLHDPHPQIRATTAKLSSSFRDAVLQDEMLSLLETEYHVLVRLEIIRAVGKMKIKRAHSLLVLILTGHSSTDEEKAAAVEALVNLIERADRADIQKLCVSPRSGLRELACRVVSHTLDNENLDLIIPLIGDSSPDVRCAAAQTIGLIRREDFAAKPMSDYLAPLLEDPDPYTAISAAWALTLYQHPQGIEKFEKWLSHPQSKVRHYAAGALASTGKYGIGLIQRALSYHPDPFVSLNLSIGLIGQRECIRNACRSIGLFLDQVPERIMWTSKGFIEYIEKSNVKFSSLIPGQPDLLDQITRLEMLNILAIVDDPQASTAARNFLKQRSWGISGMAAALLLTEGEEESIDIVEELMGDSDRKIQVQAALILALWGRGENAIKVLQDAYPYVDREMKERILEGISQIGSESSIPFLLEVWHDPSQTLRIIAAASLLKCLYH